MRKPPAIHKSKVSNPGFTLCTTKGSQVTDDPLKVTCKRCLHIMSTKTTEQGGPKPVYLVLTSNGPNRINVVKIIREFTGLGLHESKGISDAAFDMPVKIIHAMSDSLRLKACAEQLVAAGATISIQDEFGNSSDDSSILTAYREMLRLFLPEEHTSKYSTLNEYLDQFDDDEKTGHRHFPHQKTPRIADIRRWLQAGGIQ